MDIKHKLTNRILLTIPANTMVRADLTDACLVGANMKDANMKDVTMEDVINKFPPNK